MQGMARRWQRRKGPISSASNIAWRAAAGCDGGVLLGTSGKVTGEVARLVASMLDEAALLVRPRETLSDDLALQHAPLLDGQVLRTVGARVIKNMDVHL